MQTYEFTLFADYFQVYVRDGASENGLPDAWTPAAQSNWLAATGGAVGIWTARNMNVPVTVCIDDSTPATDFDIWDRVNLCSIAIPSGSLIVAGCGDYLPDAAQISVTPGTYRAHVCYGAIASISEDGLDGDDRYLFHLWPGDETPVVALKYPSAEEEDGGEKA